MLLTIRHVRSLDTAAIGIGAGTTYLAGANGAGKSTACLCAGALLAFDGELGWRTKEGRQTVLVREGARGAAAELVGDDGGGANITWPSGEVRITGEPPTASRIAVGLDKPAAMKAEERAATLIEALKAEPTEQDWRQALAAADIGAHDDVTALWSLIQRDGWDAAEKHAEKRAREKKGGWCEVTRRRAYAPSEAEAWQPEGHDGEDLGRADPDALRAAVEAAQQARDAAVRAQAVSGAERERLQGLAVKAGPLEIQLGEARRAEMAARVASGEAHAAAEGKQGRQHRATCPHCAGECVLAYDNGYAVLHLPPADGSEIDPGEAVRLQIAAREAERALEQAAKAHKALDTQVTEARAAERKLKSLPADDGGERLRQAELALAAARARREAAEATTRARQLAAEISTWSTLADLAGPEGVRKAKLAQLIELVNQTLADLCAAARWPVVMVAGDLEVTMAGRPWRALSQSERWRADAALALAIGSRDGSALIVLDGADVLDPPGRNGLARAIKATGVAALVAMTVPKAQADKMAAAGADVWWIEAGTAQRLAGERQEAA